MGGLMIVEEVISTAEGESLGGWLVPISNKEFARLVIKEDVKEA